MRAELFVSFSSNKSTLRTKIMNSVQVEKNLYIKNYDKIQLIEKKFQRQKSLFNSLDRNKSKPQTSYRTTATTESEISNA